MADKGERSAEEDSDDRHVRNYEPATPDLCDDTQSERRLLRSIIEEEIVPRLSIARSGAERADLVEARGTDAPKPDRHDRPPQKIDLERFFRVVVGSDINACRRFLARMTKEGMRRDEIYLGLLTPVARHLGELWEADAMTFDNVTIALARIQSIVHELAEPFVVGPPMDPMRRIILGRASGEQHGLGLLIVGELFRMEGWEVSGGIEIPTCEALDKRTRSEWFALAGLSVSTKAGLVGLAGRLENLRRRSCNPDIAILLGGPAFLIDGNQNADWSPGRVARDGRTAVLLAEAAITEYRQRNNKDVPRSH